MSWMRDLPRDDVEAIKVETRGEIVRWAGKPDAGRAFRRAFAIYAMAIPWCAITFTVFGVLLAAVLSGKPVTRAVSPWEYAMMGAFVLFSSAFVAAGLAMLATPFWVRSKARRTIFAITDKRILTVVTGRSQTVTTVVPDHIVKIEREEKRDGSGTLTLVTGYEKDSDGDPVTKSEELYAVRDVRAAARAVEEMRDTTRRK